MNDHAPLLIIAAGGTGGHMFPAQALAEVMLHRGWRVKLSTDARGARYTGGFPHSVEIEQVASATFARGGLRGRIVAPFRIGGGVLSMLMRMRRDRPRVVVGFGGYPSIPALSAATLLRLPRSLLTTTPLGLRSPLMCRTARTPRERKVAKERTPPQVRGSSKLEATLTIVRWSQMERMSI